MNTGLITTEGLYLFSIDELSLETRSHLIRDVACSVFFGYYDYRNGYINDDFKKGVNLKGIYGFFDTIKNASEILTDYHKDYFDEYNDSNSFDKKFDIVFWKHHPYLGFDFTNLINDFHYHLKHLAKKYNFIINGDFCEKVVPGVLDELIILCDKFMPDIDEDFYHIKGFSTKYITAVNMTYEVELLPTMPQIFKPEVYNYELYGNEVYRNNEHGEKVLYARQNYEYDNKGEVEKITTTIIDKFGGDVIVRYRDTFI